MCYCTVWPCGYYRTPRYISVHHGAGSAPKGHRPPYKVCSYLVAVRNIYYYIPQDNVSLKPSGYYIYHHVLRIQRSTFCPHTVFMCFVLSSEQTAIISLHSINWLVFITETECLLRGTDWVFNVIWVICFIWIWEQIAIISLYSINWLVCIAETESVYCAVRTGYLNVIWVICFIWISEQTASISLYSINWLVFITEIECVYCAVRTGYLNVIQSNLIY